MALSFKTPGRFIKGIYLDLRSVPGRFMGKKGNALWHLKHVCPKCSEHRKSFRDPDGGTCCLWLVAWKNGEYDVPRDFGILNYLRYYLGMRTNLSKYRFGRKSRKK